MATERKRGEIHLGDLVRVLADLPWQGPDQAAAIAACLGFGLRPHRTPTPSEQPHRVAGDRTPTQPPDIGEQAHPAPKTSCFPPRPPRPVPLPEGAVRCELSLGKGRAPPNPDPPPWLADAARDFPSREPVRALARATLLPERTARHALSATLATERSGADIDLSRLLDAICRRQPLRTLPRRPETTVAAGCQLLLDYSPGMVPFWEDLNALAEQVRDVVGEPANRVYAFDADPGSARHWTAAGDAQAWQPDGRPVLVATDLGIQGRAPADPHPGWTAFAADCARAGSPLLLLIPWPEERWPRAFPANTTLIHWGPRTSASRVRRLALGSRRR